MNDGRDPAMTSARENSVRVLFLGGVGRSGTTLIERTLATDDRITGLGEVMHLWRRSLVLDELCGCGQRFSRCPFWSEVGLRAFGGWDKINPHRLAELKGCLDRVSRVPQLALRAGRRRWRADLAEYADYYARLYTAAADVAGTDVVVDSSKQASLPFILSHDRRIDLRVLHCVRDSRAVAYSWTKTVLRPEAQALSAQTMQRYSPARMSVTWLLHNGALELLPVMRVPAMRLRYEDWVKNPSRSVARILQFCNLPGQSSVAVGQDFVKLGMSHTCSGNPLRFQEGHVNVRADNHWRASFEGGARLLVTMATSPLLAAYRYFWDTA